MLVPNVEKVALNMNIKILVEKVVQLKFTEFICLLHLMKALGSRKSKNFYNWLQRRDH